MSEIDLITEAFEQLLSGRLPAPIRLSPDTPPGETRQLAAAVNRFLEQHRIAADAMSTIACGDVDREIPKCRLHICQSLKNLQANLRHLTWKTQQVADGDYAQRVDFMGEFSESFNRMVETLAKNREELQRQNQELQTASRTDPLTGLLNRRGAWEVLRREASRTNRTGRPFALVLVDIDHFKRVNDVYGHDAGDAVLVHVAAVFRARLRVQDSFARWGGEEFLVIAADTGLFGGATVAAHLRSAVADAAIVHHDQTIRVTISAGVSQYEKDADIDACIKQADLCLFDAKARGRNQVCTPQSLLPPSLGAALPLTRNGEPVA